MNSIIFSAKNRLSLYGEVDGKKGGVLLSGKIDKTEMDYSVSISGSIVCGYFERAGSKKNAWIVAGHNIVRDKIGGLLPIIPEVAHADYVIPQALLGINPGKDPADSLRKLRLMGNLLAVAVIKAEPLQHLYEDLFTEMLRQATIVTTDTDIEMITKITQSVNVSNSLPR